MNKYFIILSEIYNDSNILDKEILYDIIKDKDSQLKLFNLIIKHRLSVMAYNRFIKWGVWDDLLRCIRDQLIAMKSYHMLRLQYLENAFLEINTLLLQNEIQYACLKGFVLLDKLYIDKEEREFNDIDFLVSKKELSKVEELLFNAGYSQCIMDKFYSKQDTPLRETIIYWKMATHQLFPFRKNSPLTEYSVFNAINVDINFSVFFGGKLPDPIPSQNFLKHTETKIYSNKIKYIALEDTYNFLQLCISIYKDTIYKKKQSSGENFKLLNMLDLHRYMKMNLIDFDLLYKISESSGILYELAQVFMITKSLFCDSDKIMGKSWEFVKATDRQGIQYKILGG